MDKLIGYIKILDPNGSYFIKDSVLPVYQEEDGGLYVLEDYEGGNPSDHPFADIIEDGIKFSFSMDIEE